MLLLSLASLSGLAILLSDFDFLVEAEPDVPTDYPAQIVSRETFNYEIANSFHCVFIVLLQAILTKLSEIYQCTKKILRSLGCWII